MMIDIKIFRTVHGLIRKRIIRDLENALLINVIVLNTIIRFLAKLEGKVPSLR